MTVPRLATGNEPEPMSAGQLVEDARLASGLPDPGSPGFVANLELLIESCRQSAELTVAGWGVIRKIALRHLRNQLYHQASLAARPDIVDQPIVAPIVITGLPRTGTTLLHNLLALDPANRVLRFWEGLHPVPMEAGAETAMAAMVERAETWLSRLYTLAPEFRSIHYSTARGPEECDALLQNAFASQHFDDMFRAESYSAWLNHADLVDEYAYYARQLQGLNAAGDQHLQWVLKSPSHLGYLDTVLQSFPDAAIVLCHRAPGDAIASYASLVQAVRSPHTDRLSLTAIGSHVLNRCAIATQRALLVRDKLGDEQFIDVRYRDLAGDPVAVVKAVYARHGRELGDQAELAMRSWISENPQHKHGQHRYSLQTFGLTPALVLEALGDYPARFRHEIN